MSLNAPKVSVVMAIYNGEKYLEQATESILNQSFKDFEFIIINDGSMDGTGAILSSLQIQDRRIRVYNQENKGLTESLNRGIKLSVGKYIARMDADDISLPERLEREYYFLEAHPEIGIVGTWAEAINENSKPIRKLKPPAASDVIRWFLLFGNCLVHPSVMMRRAIVDTLCLYRTEAIGCEDYDLWVRANAITQINNIPEVLIRYREWKSGVSKRHLEKTEQYETQLMRTMMTSLLGRDILPEVPTNLWRITHHSFSGDLPQVEASAVLIDQLRKAYLKANTMNHQEAMEINREAGNLLCIVAISVGRYSWRRGSSGFDTGSET